MIKKIIAESRSLRAFCNPPLVVRQKMIFRHPIDQAALVLQGRCKYCTDYTLHSNDYCPTLGGLRSSDETFEAYAERRKLWHLHQISFMIHEDFKIVDTFLEVVDTLIEKAETTVWTPHKQRIIDVKEISQEERHSYDKTLIWGGDNWRVHRGD